MGTAVMGATIDKAESFRMLDRYVELGGNMIDTAHCYSDWIPGERSRSEKLIGEWLRESKLAKSALIATKGGHPVMGTLVPRLSREEITEDVEESLAFLGISCIDLYWLHRDDRDRPVGDILATMNDLVKAGKIRYFGCSNWKVDRIAEAEEYARSNGMKSFVGSQISWSLAAENKGSVSDPTLVSMDAESKRYYGAGSISVWAYSSQANGFFTKMAQGGVDSLKRGLVKKFVSPLNLARFEKAQQLADELNVSITAVALAYLTSQPFPTVPIIGCSSLEQLEQSMEARDIALTPEMIARFV
jgi:aryl-alcohol dehydrogenase-like predicted oxidoreductase